ncbi:MAG: NnrU family protein [Rhodospirillales bacterium]|nr:NnrU family protein [Rhodospirillales bacterium]
MAEFILAIAVFIASHLIPAIAPLRGGLVKIIGERGFIIAFSTLSTAIIIWLGFAFAAAPYIELWEPSEWSRWVPAISMPIACILTVTGFTSRNPFSLGGGAGGYDPQNPGIVSVTRHPVLWALAIWSGSHIAPNGDMAAALLFGLFVALCLIGIMTIERRRRVRMGEAQWQALSALNSIIPFAAALTGKTSIDWEHFCGWRLIAGLALYATLFYGHEYVIGITPNIF